MPAVKGISNGSLILGSWTFIKLSLFGICDVSCGLVPLHVDLCLSSH